MGEGEGKGDSKVAREWHTEEGERVNLSNFPGHEYKGGDDGGERREGTL